MKRFMQFFAPDEGGASAAVAASQAPIEVTESPSVAADYSVEEVQLEPPTGVIGPKEAMGDDGTDEMERMEANMEGRPVRERDPATGKFLPKGKKAEEANLVPKKEEAKAAEKKPVAAKKVAAKPSVQPKPEAAPAKIKIGDQEKTADEWAKEFAEAQEKIKAAEAAAKAPPAPAEKKEETPAPKPEELKAQEQEKFEKFIEAAAAKYDVGQDGLDVILTGGGTGSQKLARLLSGVEGYTRKAMVDEFNPIIKEMWDKIQPLIGRDQALAEYKREHTFLSENPDIKDHPKGYEEYQKTVKEMRDGETRIRAEIAAGTASDRDRAWIAFHDTFTPEQVMESVARITKEKLAALPKAEAEPKPEPEKKVQKTPAASKPFNGDRPGGSSSTPSTETADARQLREMSEAGY